MLRHLFRGHGCRFSRPDFDDEASDGRGRHGHRGGREGFGGGRGGGFGGRRGGRGERRVFDHGDLRLVLSWLIAEKPRSGYDLIKTIEGRSVRRVDDLLNALERHRAGDVLTLEIEREGDPLTVQVTLQAAADR